MKTKYSTQSEKLFKHFVMNGKNKMEPIKKLINKMLGIDKKEKNREEARDKAAEVIDRVIEKNQKTFDELAKH